MKTRRTESTPTARDALRRANPIARPGETEKTRPRNERDRTQKGPGSASADLQMTADGNAGRKPRP